MRALVSALALTVAAPAAAQSVDAEIQALTVRIEKAGGDPRNQEVAARVRLLRRPRTVERRRPTCSPTREHSRSALTASTRAGLASLNICGAYHGGQDGLVYGQLNEWVTLQPASRSPRMGATQPRAGGISACSAVQEAC